MMKNEVIQQSMQPRRVIRRPTASLKARLHQMLAREIGIQIVTGVYKPGESLPGEIVASQSHGVSRNAYREAVRILAAKGLVESRQKAGTLVLTRDRWNLLDPDVLRWILSNNPDTGFRDGIFELREIVEPAAAELAAKRRTEEDLRMMEKALEGMQEHAPDSLAGEQADERFHTALFNGSGNESLSRLASIIAASVEFVADFKRSQDVQRDPVPDHQKLFEAIRDQRPSEAREAMAKLISHAREDMMATRRSSGRRRVT